MRSFSFITLARAATNAGRRAWRFQEEGACFDWYFTKTRGAPVKPDRLRLRLTPQDDGTVSWKFGEAPQCKPHHKTLRLYFGPDGKLLHQDAVMSSRKVSVPGRKRMVGFDTATE